MVTNDDILKKVKKKVLEVDPGAKIILFGSRARKDFRNDSDWDFLILTEMQVTIEWKNKIMDALFELELETDQVFTAIVKNIEEWDHYINSPIHKNVAKEGVEL